MNSPRQSRRNFLVCSSALAIAGSQAITATAAAQEKPASVLRAYIGTFSSPLKDMLPTQVDLPPGNGRGIHIFDVDRETGALKPSGLCESGTSPSCLAVNRTGNRLYSANETDRIGDSKEGTVSAWAIDPATGGLSLLNTVRSGGEGPTYVSIHPSGRFLLVANYFGGSVSVLPIQSDGKLSEPSDVRTDTGPIGPAQAPHAPEGSFAFSGHDRTHAHMIQSDAAGKFILHVDLGLDRLYVWAFDDRTGKLSAGTPGWVALPPGDGPRHFHFHPNGQWLYSIQEEGSTIVLFDYDSRNGTLKSRQTVSTLPQGFVGSNFCSEILVSEDGRFVYAGNRLHDSIGIFSVGSTGELTHIADEWTRGNYPRSFSFDPTGRFLYCANQRADNVAIFAVDRATGLLKFTGRYAPVGNPSHIVFVEFPEPKIAE
ncbi:MAG: lactonase family protein [Planctomycetaceae bacterium]